MAVDRYTFKERTYICPKDEQKVKKLAWDYEPAPACGCGEQMVEDIGQFSKGPCVIGDDIPGGMLVHNAICNDDGSPRRFYSKSEMRRAAAEKGYVNVVEHKPARGTDKSPHTTRWV